MITLKKDNLSEPTQIKPTDSSKAFLSLHTEDRMKVKKERGTIHRSLAFK